MVHLNVEGQKWKAKDASRAESDKINPMKDRHRGECNKIGLPSRKGFLNRSFLQGLKGSYLLFSKASKLIRDRKRRM